MIPLGQSSLIKYSTPFLVSVSPLKQKEKQDGSSTTEALLSQIIRPKLFHLENNQLWKQTVLPTPATKSEVIYLEEQLDKQLQLQNAIPEGLCPKRQQLYEECYDELIRQITIDCKQRGLLLVKVRDELKQQQQEYQKLYESCIGYGMRKVVEKEGQRGQLKQDIMTYSKEQEEL